jgi:hypothetical protein
MGSETTVSSDTIKERKNRKERKNGTKHLYKVRLAKVRLRQVR